MFKNWTMVVWHQLQLIDSEAEKMAYSDTYCSKKSVLLYKNGENCEWENMAVEDIKTLHDK